MAPDSASTQPPAVSEPAEWHPEALFSGRKMGKIKTLNIMTFGYDYNFSSITSPSWWGKPIVRTAWYTDLASGAWHAGLYSLFLSFWTFIMVSFIINNVMFDDN